MVRVVIVEDQPNLAAEARTYLERLPTVVVVAMADSVATAQAVIPMTSPDVVLMDIVLPDGSSFDILESLSPLAFKVIFVTAYEEHAIRAIKLGALDYLLKPLDPDELSLAFQRVQATAAATPGQLQLAKQEYLQDRPVRIALREGPVLHVLDLDEIVYLQHLDKTQIYLQDGSTVGTLKSLKELEELLPADRFIRVHQSVMVQVKHVLRFHKDGQLLLRNGQTITVSARRKDFVMNFLLVN